MQKYLFILLLFLASCDTQTQMEKDTQLIQNYLSTHGLEATQDASGLFYIEQVPGTGLFRPTTEDTVVVKYTGYLLNGVYFDKTEDGSTDTFALSKLVEGWQIGVPMMTRGAVNKLLIPSELGYGSTEKGIIPANSVIIFDIELVDFY